MSGEDTDGESWAVWGMGMYEKPLDLLPGLAARLNLFYKHSINLQRFVLFRKALLVAAWPTRTTLMCLEGVRIVLWDSCTLYENILL